MNELEEKTLLHLIVGEPLSGKTSALMNILREKHLSDPFSYRFVGPSGFFVREFADSFTKKVGSIVRENFMSIDEFAVKVYRDMYPHLVHVSREFTLEILSWVLDELSDELKMSKSIIKSSRFIESTLDLIHDIKEMGILDEEKLHPDIPCDILKIHDEYEKRIKELGVFDTFDAYLGVDVKHLKKGEYGRYLFLDGFYDLSPALRKFLINIVKTYDEIYMTCTEDGREIFKSSGTILNFFDEMTNDGCVGIKERVKPKRFDKRCFILKNIFNKEKIPLDSIKDFIEIRRFKNHHFEVKALAREIKKNIVDGRYNPGDVAIITGDFPTYSKLFQREFEEYGIPYRLEGDMKLIESHVIKILTLPFRAVSSGYMTDVLLSMVDFGYVDEVDAKEFETIALDLKLIYGHLRTSFKRRKEEWIEKIRKEIEREKKSLKDLEDVVEFPSELNGIREYIRMLEKAEKAVIELFKFLEPISSGGKKDVEFFKMKIMEWMKKLKILEKLMENKRMDEILALKSFVNSLENLEIFLKKARKFKLTTNEYYKFLQLVLETNNYKPFPDLDNRVEILSLEASRFKVKKYKIFVGFIDGVYPRVFYNPLRLQNEREYQRMKENQQKLDLLISFMKTTDGIILSMPETDINGEPILPSPFISEIVGEELIERSSVDNEMGFEEEPMSFVELKTKYMLRNYPENRITDVEKILKLDNVIKSVERSRLKDRFKVKDVNILSKRIGNKFSFSKINTYEKCPFKFFLRYFMNIPDTKKSRFEFSNLEKGIIYHRILKEIFDADIDDLIEFKEIRNELLKRSIKRNVEAYIYHDDELIKEKEFSYFFDYLSRFLEKLFAESNDLEIEKKMETYPVELEVNVDHTEDNVRIFGKPIKLIGRIDRVDKLKDEEKYFIVDYKISANTSEYQKRQLLLYAYIYNTIKGNGCVFGGCNLVIEKPRKSNIFEIDYREDDEWIAKFSKRRMIKLSDVINDLKMIMEGIESGEFKPKENYDCNDCPYSRICRSLDIAFYS